METLTADEASELAGVPAAQLVRWAWDDWSVLHSRPHGLTGPRSCGTRRKPMWRRRDIEAWRARHEAGTAA